MAQKKDNLHKNHRSRMFDKALHSVETFADHEILEMLLFSTNPQKNMNVIAHALLKRFKTFKGVLGASPEELKTVDGVGPKTAVYIKILQEMFKRSSMDDYKIQKLNTSALITEYIKNLFSYETFEKLYAVCLDSNYNLLSAVQLSNAGSSSSAAINSDEAIRKLILTGAKSVVLAHNHLQSGVIPTQDDVDTTKVLMQKMLGVGIIFRDHIIVNGADYFSFSEQGWLDIWAQKSLSPVQFSALYKSGSKIASGGVKLNENDFGLII